MPTFVITTEKPEDVKSINPTLEPIYESGAFRIYAVNRPEVALRQWDNSVDVLSRDLAAEAAKAIIRAEGQTGKTKQP